MQQGKQGTAEHAGELALLAHALELRGDCAQAGRLYVDAVDMYEKAPGKTAREGLDSVNFLNDLGCFRLRHGRPLEAIAPLRRAVQLHETISANAPTARADALSSLAFAHFRTEQWEESSERFLQAIELRLTSASPAAKVIP